MAQHRSMRGKEVDMNKLFNQNEMTPVVGNIKVNARGDLLGPGGKIIPRESNTVTTTTHVPSQTHRIQESAEAMVSAHVPTVIIAPTPFTEEKWNVMTPMMPILDDTSPKKSKTSSKSSDPDTTA